MTTKQKQRKEKKCIASCTDKTIKFYFDRDLSKYVQGKWVNDCIYVSLKKKRKKKKRNSSFNVKTIFTGIITLTISILLYLLLYIIFSVILSTISIPNIFSLWIAYFLYFLTNLYSITSTYKFIMSKSKKSNHSAEHMIINFIEKYDRLPVTLRELKKVNRFNDNCSSLKLFINDMKSFDFFIPFILLILGNIYYIIKYLIQVNIYIKISIVLSILLFIFILLKSNLLLYFFKKLNNFIQLSTTTKNVSDRSLALAYYVARLWMLKQFPECANENWMTQNEFLDSYELFEIP